ncbi:hypothetical protein ROBYS_44960 [Roseobacter sp. OBYS 0001]|nr:hypothetical protein ROBYS_44960 [Roseobacter sp. OBYS 0001]
MDERVMSADSRRLDAHLFRAPLLSFRVSNYLWLSQKPMSGMHTKEKTFRLQMILRFYLSTVFDSTHNTLPEI